ncbi:helix-turn-helix domain-containing protein [Lentzea sp. JNUCC 0626]|uniref:helix-turn-helix domain-containing protein n=1 Tax=Lentzea sp. JNUCC 0626 TaxID=3367513 RepID=UPI003747A588
MPQRTEPPRRAALNHSPEALRWARRAKGWTQRQLADVIGVKATSVSDFERGTRSAPPDLLIKIARAFRCPVSMLEAWDPQDREASRVLDQISALVRPANREAA